MLDWLKKNAAKAQTAIGGEVSRYRNRPFMEATAAACAMIAAADGEVSAAEKLKMTGFIERSPQLLAFNVKEIVAAFNETVDKFAFDYQIGQAQALQTINKMKGDNGAARLLVRLACAVGASDGSFDESEKAACRLICLELALDPAEFEL